MRFADCSFGEDGFGGGQDFARGFLFLLGKGLLGFVSDFYGGLVLVFWVFLFVGTRAGCLLMISGGLGSVQVEIPSHSL